MKKNILFILFFLFLLSSCGKTIIFVADKNREYKIYLNEVYIGNNSVKINRSGFPDKKIIHVKNTSDELVKSIEIKRRINYLKFAVGLTCFFPYIFCSWQYPKKVEIVVPIEKLRSIWEDVDSDSLGIIPSTSVWD